MPFSFSPARPIRVLGVLLLASTLLTPTISLAQAQAQTKATAPAVAQATLAQPRFAHETSDVAVDPAARFGRLPNGMGYVIYKNATPKGTAVVRLRVGAGSLMETERQRGLAHFIEHMAFNGTKNVPEGEMVKMLERYGLKFGPDTNAYTSFDETVYMLDLPRTDAEVVDTALMLMRETAGNITFDAAAIDRERGVILGEERTRNSPALRNFEAMARFLVPGQKLGERLPIGTVDVIKTAPRQEFIDFYTTWYRPERTTLIVVGDIDPADIEAKIKLRFSDWTVPGKAVANPDFGQPKPRAFAHAGYAEAGAGNSISLNWVRNLDNRPDSEAKRLELLREDLVLDVLNRRFSEAAQSGKASYLSASFSTQDLPKSAELTVLGIVPKEGQAEKALAEAEQMLRQFREFGVSEAELTREITETKASYKAAADAATTRNNATIAMTIVGGLNGERVFTAPQQNLARLDAALKGFDAKAATSLIPTIIPAEPPLLFATTPAPIKTEALAQALSASQAVKVAARAQDNAVAWPYSQFGTPGKVTKTVPNSEFGFTTVTFANGVTLLHKQTDFKKDQVLVDVSLNTGTAFLPSGKFDPSGLLAFTGLYAGGLKALNQTDIDKALAGKVYSLNFALREDEGSLNGATRPQDLRTQFEVLSAFLTEPGLRPEPFERIRNLAPVLFQQVMTQPQGVFSFKANAILRDGDKRWALPEQAELQAAKTDDIAAATRPLLQQAPFTVKVVGDIPLEKAIEEAARTFGALPSRGAERQPAKDSLSVRFPKPTGKPVVLTHKGRADQALAFAAWPTTDSITDTRRARALRLLSEVLSNRLLAEVREKQGASYSASASSSQSDIFPGYGYISVSAPVTAANVDGFYDTARSIAAALATGPITQDEIDRARKPILENWKNRQKDNQFWIGGLSLKAKDLTDLRSYEADYQAITANELQTLAKTWLKPETFFAISVLPETPAAPASTPAQK
ncbi:MAG: M16 family metallopeptidase [Asticcacaulis sp.]